jgi:hypothetical protein
MTLTWIDLADHHDDDMLALPKVSIPPREQLGGPEPNAPAHSIGFGQGFRNPISVLRQQIRMSLGDMALPLLRQLDFTLKVRARIAIHRAPLFVILTFACA